MDNQYRNRLALAALINIQVGLAFWAVNKRSTKKKRSTWTKEWIRRRQEGRGTLNLLNRELRIEDRNSYRNFIRLDEDSFVNLLNMVQNDIQKKNTVMRDSISAEHRLNITLRFLATGESFRSLMYSTRVHESTISKIIPEVCEVIFKNLKEQFLQTPHKTTEWLNIAANFESAWNFPNCVGALDGRHITFNAPISAGSYYYNYKGTHSIVLLGLVDANYKFIYVNVGVNGRISDGGVFEASNLYCALVNKKLNLPEPALLPGSSIRTPYVIVADDAFPLMENVLKPYPQKDLDHDKRIFNYRLSRCRRMVESAFGILANRWRVLLKPIPLSPDKVQKITLACVTLHNYMIDQNTSYTDRNEEPEKSVCLSQITRQGANRHSTSARNIRDSYRDYFNSAVGAVPWQENAVNRGNY